MAVTGNNLTYFYATPGVSPYPQMTIAAWIKPNTSATNANAFFQIFGNPTGYQFNIHLAGNPPNVFGSACQSNNGTTIDGTGIGGSPYTGWHFVATTFDNGGTAGQVGTVKIYIDGVLNNTVTTGGPVTALQNNDAISKIQVCPGNTDGGGTLAYPMIWKRLVTPAEISALYNSGAGADPRAVAGANLAVFVALNQATGNTPDLATPAINWMVTGGTFTVVADPFSLAVPTTPGSPIAATTTVDTLFGSLFTNRANTQGTISYQWSDPSTVMGSYADGSCVLAHFEARGLTPTVIMR